ncbi:YheC/YheD family endospore coat-associated protein [Brevibacillus fluminis]|uniref:YheC/YheD family endospore coat-associated protein n=1 Tax=Brevibacillus fluminis TaxID=511487 RepID=UPI003F895BAF
MSQPCIGILTWRNGTRFGEPAFFRRLIRAGQKLGATVFLFSLQDVALERRRVRGFVPDKVGKWKSKWYPWPDIVLDRYRYYPLKRHEAYLPFRQQNLFRYANSRFANKWKVHQMLWDDGRLRPWLPETYAYERGQLEQMLTRHRLLYVKPSNGTGGRSILRIESTPHGYLLWGRGKKQNKEQLGIKTKAELCAFVESWIQTERSGNEIFLIQQGLELNLIPDRTADIRLLIQKNKSGEWKTTGIGARIGASHSSTSNLHGGGKAMAALDFLVEHFGESEAQRIISECRSMAKLAVHAIEEKYGQMVEFGMDIGVDTSGHVWLIEINPKPGREIFRELGDMKRYEVAIRRPLEYALYLLDQEGA